MLKRGNLISTILLCVGLIMICIACLLLTISLEKVQGRVSNLEEQNETILYKYETQEKQIYELNTLYINYASETDARISELTGDIEELRLEKEVKEVELHKNAEPETTEEVVEEATTEEATEEASTSIGTYELTAYEWTGNPCANGNYPTEGYTVACNSLPLGTRIYIEGYGEYTVEDRGGMSDNVIDIYMGDYSSCIQFGRRTANVYIVD